MDRGIYGGKDKFELQGKKEIFLYVMYFNKGYSIENNV